MFSITDESLYCVSSLQITKPFFSALGDENVQQKLLSVMFDLLVESRSPLVANTVSSVFKGVREQSLFGLNFYFTGVSQKSKSLD